MKVCRYFCNRCLEETDPNLLYHLDLRVNVKDASILSGTFRKVGYGRYITDICSDCLAHLGEALKPEKEPALWREGP